MNIYRSKNERAEKNDLGMMVKQGESLFCVNFPMNNHINGEL